MRALSGREGKRILAYSVMRVVACVAIVILHTTNVAEMLYKDTISVTQDAVSLIVVYCMMWAVPCFVMVTGSLLLDPAKEIGIGKIFRSYLLRAAGALVLFGLVFRIIDCLMNGEEFSALTIADAFLKIFTGKSWSHLWYLYVLIGLYLLLPLYRSLIKKAEETEIRYVLIVMVIFLSILPLTKCFDLNSKFDLPISGIYTLYFLLGVAITRGTVRIPRIAAVLLFFLGLGATIAVGVIRFRYGIDALDPLISSYSSPFVVMQTVGIYSWIVGEAPGRGSNRLIEFLDENGFGIYLVHMIFLRLALRYFGIDPYTLGVWSFVLLVAGNLVLSCILTWMLRRIPGLKRVL